MIQITLARSLTRELVLQPLAHDRTSASGARAASDKRERTIRLHNLPEGTQEGLLQQALEKIVPVTRIEVFARTNEAIAELHNQSVRIFPFHPWGAVLIQRMSAVFCFVRSHSYSRMRSSHSLSRAAVLLRKTQTQPLPCRSRHELLGGAGRRLPSRGHRPKCPPPHQHENPTTSELSSSLRIRRDAMQRKEKPSWSLNRLQMRSEPSRRLFVCMNHPIAKSRLHQSLKRNHLEPGHDGSRHFEPTHILPVP